MLSRNETLKSSRQIHYILKKGKRCSSSFFRATYLPVRENELPRYLSMVSKKVMKSAVKRNVMRRRVFHLIKIHTQKPVHVIIHPRKEVYDTQFSRLEEDFKALMQKIV